MDGGDGQKEKENSAEITFHFLVEKRINSHDSNSTIHFFRFGGLNFIVKCIVEFYSLIFFFF